MGLILSIETSTEVCSVALSEEGKTIDQRVIYEGQSHASALTALIEEMLTGEGRPSFKSLDAVAVSSGPGSYTGLRIGVSAAKGICYALGIPLISVDSLQVVAAGIGRQPDEDYQILPMIDARRMEVYTELFTSQLIPASPTEAIVVDNESFADILNKGKVIFAGNGSHKCKGVINHSNAIFIGNIHPLASNMSKLAYNAFLRERFEDVAYFEPQYLKDFIVTTPKNKIL